MMLTPAEVTALTAGAAVLGALLASLTQLAVLHRTDNEKIRLQLVETVAEVIDAVSILHDAPVFTYWAKVQHIEKSKATADTYNAEAATVTEIVNDAAKALRRARITFAGDPRLTLALDALMLTTADVRGQIQQVKLLVADGQDPSSAVRGVSQLLPTLGTRARDLSDTAKSSLRPRTGLWGWMRFAWRTFRLRSERGDLTEEFAKKLVL